MSSFMNPAHGAHMMAGKKPMGKKSETDSGKGGSEKAGGHMHLHFHGHEKGVTVHVMHASGKHEKHEHAHGDSEGMAQHIHANFGSGEAAPTPPEAEPPVQEPEDEAPLY